MNDLWDYEKNTDDRLGKMVEDKGIGITYTTPEMAKHLIDFVYERHPDYTVWMEPCLGSGSFYDNFPDDIKGEWCEIIKGVDYLEYDGMVDLTISNPPFVPRKLFWSFHIKAMETTRHYIYWLINLSSLNVFTPKRMEEMTEKGWFVQHIHIVQDKRWFGRYCLVEFGRVDNGLFSFHRKTF